ncbi:biliverdin-producing heme oxygenase [Mycobacterium helveticum]|uniref:biliverdin-producing heme oxygenase n=1 Tax=Mycobacterium helveticum TaxID=2592811 RepID=UPI00143E0564|nr:biliverdin-producing heme oxygenase [Mycobacterium helveticum]
MDRARERGPGAGWPRSGRPGLSQTLRDRTAQAHRTAEATMPFESGRPDASEYLGVLTGLLTFHTVVAEFSRATVAKELDPDVTLLSRLPALRADIRLMSQQVPTAAAEERVFPGGPVLAHRLRGGREERIGAAYVAAGSVLGGRVIAANLAASGCGDFPRSFFASDGLELGRLWRRFTTAVDVFGESGADPARVVEGALAAFALISDIMRAPDASPVTTR